MCAPIASNAAGSLTMLLNQIISLTIMGGLILANFGKEISSRISRILVTFKGSV